MKAKDFGKILEYCDDLRDNVLPMEGVRLEDFAIGVPSTWKYDNKEDLLR